MCRQDKQMMVLHLPRRRAEISRSRRAVQECWKTGLRVASVASHSFQTYRKRQVVDGLCVASATVGITMNAKDCVAMLGQTTVYFLRVADGLIGAQVYSLHIRL